MSELRELYQEVILDHSKRPRNRRLPASADGVRIAHGNNPLCGDKIQIFLTVENDRIADISFEGSGCAISTASASMMTESLIGKTLDEARNLFDGFHHLLTTEESATAVGTLGKLEVFSGVREFPVRVKCATLPWHTFQAALEESPETVSNE